MTSAVAMSAFNRPGVSDEFLARAGCHHVGSDECVQLYGCRAEGIAIPLLKQSQGRHEARLPKVMRGHETRRWLLPGCRVVRVMFLLFPQPKTRCRETGGTITIRAQ